MKPILTLIALMVLVTTSNASEIVDAARSQIGKTVTYDPSYQGLSYPGGDIPLDRGVCTDVVIRALRSSRNMDLQELIHNDMKRNFSVYPKIWGLKTTDRNIDHRRVPNLITYFKRMGYELSSTKDPENYLPGDLVTCIVPPHLPHIMIVSDKKNSKGIPYVIHNIGRGTIEENRLFDFELTGHFRIKESGKNRSAGAAHDSQ